MTPERRQRDEKLFARSESTALEDRNEFKLRSHMFHSHHIISPLEAPYFV